MKFCTNSQKKLNCCLWISCRLEVKSRIGKSGSWCITWALLCVFCPLPLGWSNPVGWFKCSVLALLADNANFSCKLWGAPWGVYPSEIKHSNPFQLLPVVSVTQDLEIELLMGKYSTSTDCFANQSLDLNLMGICGFKTFCWDLRHDHC